MQAFITSLISAALAVVILSILSPTGTANGIAKHVHLLSALFLIVVTISPVKELITGLHDLANGDLTFPEIEIPDQNESEELLQSVLDGAAQEYFSDSLTALLEREFEIEQGDIRCKTVWEIVDMVAKPKKITVLLSGKAIWKNPSPIEAYVENLLGCECVTAIESK